MTKNTCQSCSDLMTLTTYLSNASNAQTSLYINLEKKNVKKVRLERAYFYLRHIDELNTNKFNM